MAEELKTHPAVRQLVETEDGWKLILPKGSRVLSHVFHLADEHDVQITNVNVQVPTLEDVFLHLTGRRLRD